MGGWVALFNEASKSVSSFHDGVKLSSILSLSLISIREDLEAAPERTASSVICEMKRSHVPLPLKRMNAWELYCIELPQSVK